MNVAPGSVNCGGGTVTLTLAAGAFQSGQTIEVRLANGAVVKDVQGNAQPQSDAVQTTIP